MIGYVLATMNQVSRQLGLALAVLAAIAGQPAVAEDLPAAIRISTGAGSPFGKNVSGANSGLAAARGVVEQEFAADGTKIEWFHTKGGGPGSNEALANGTVDIGYAGEFPAIFGRAGGLRTRFLGLGFRGNNAYLIVPKASPAASILDLRGKRIAITQSQPWEYSFHQLLRQNGLQPTDVKLVNLSLADSQQALERGDVDALYSIASALILVRQDKGRVIWSTREAPRDWLFVADFFVSEDFAKKYPTAVKRFAKAIIRVNYWVSQQQNLDEAQKIWASGGFPLETYQDEYRDADLKYRFSPIPDASLLAHYRRAAEFMLQNKLIRRAVDVDGWVDRSFVDQALQELGLVGYWPDYSDSGVPPAGASQ